MVSRLNDYLYLYKRMIAITHIKEKKFFSLLIISSLLLYGFFMRFYKLSQFFYFTHDEETMAFRVLPALTTNKLFLIGGVTPLHIHTTPYNYYLSAVVLKMGNLDPIIWGVLSGMLGLMTIIVIYKVGTEAINRRVGFIAAFLYAGSYLAALYDRHYWPLSFDQLLGIIVFGSLFQIIQKRLVYIYPLVLAMIFGFSSDWSNLLFFIIVPLAWVIWRLPVRKKEVSKAFSLLILSFLPLILFDIRHGLENINGIRLFLAERKEMLGWSYERFLDTLFLIPQSMIRLLHVFGNNEIAFQYSYCSEHSDARLQAVPWLMMGLLITASIIVACRLRTKLPPREKTFLHLLILFFATGFISINLYGNVSSSKLHEHYLATLFPAAFLFFGYILSLVWQKNRWLIVALLTLFFAVNTVSLVNANNTVGYQSKKAAVRYALSQLKNYDFALESLGSCYRYGGWRYLFYLAGREPVKSYVDQNYFWLYSQPPARNHPDWLVVMVTAERSESEAFWKEYNRYRNGAISSSYFGGTEVLIVDNRTHEFNGRF